MSAILAASPNGVAATVTLPGQLIKPYSKITVPKLGMDGHQLTEAFPFSAQIFGSRLWASRMSFITDGNQTHISVNIVGQFEKQLQRNEWRSKIEQGVADDIQSLTAKEIPIFNQSKIEQFDFPIEEPIDNFEDLSPEQKKLLQEFHKAVDSNRLSKHSGGYDIVDLTPHKGGFFSKASGYVAHVATYGNCAGCGDFDETFGHTPKAVTAALKTQGITGAHSLKSVVQIKAKGPILVRRGPS